MRLKLLFQQSRSDAGFSGSFDISKTFSRRRIPYQRDSPQPAFHTSERQSWAGRMDGRIGAGALTFR
jgi:hypothetical protein